MPADQTWVGGGGEITVRGVETGAAGRFRAPGQRPRIQIPGGGNTGIEMRNRTHAAGFDIDGTSAGVNDFVNNETGIQVLPGRQRVLIGDLRLRNIGDEGIDVLENVRDVRIVGLWLDGTADEVITLRDGVRNVEIKGVRARNIGEEGVFLSDDSGNGGVRACPSETWPSTPSARRASRPGPG